MKYEDDIINVLLINTERGDGLDWLLERPTLCIYNVSWYFAVVTTLANSCLLLDNRILSTKIASSKIP